MTAVDEPGPPREGEALDAGALEGYVGGRLPGGAAPSVRQFRQGHSNLTYLVSVGDREYVLRRPPFGNLVKTAHDMGREFRILSALAPVFPLAPRPLLFCEDETVIGAPFYLMERRRGVVLRRTLPDGLRLDPALAGRLSEAMVDTLVALHRLDHRTIGLDGLGKPQGYGRRQVDGWTRRYRAAATEVVPHLDRVAEWLAERVPPEAGAAVIHNDFKFDNVMLAADDPGRLVAVLDWEMATVGDPLMDLGAALAYWVEPADPPALRSVAMGPTTLPGMWTRERIVAEYAARTGRTIVDPAFYLVFGLFKLAVIIQQIYARFARGVTRDERFRTMNRMVAVLGDQAAAEAGLR